MTNKLTSSFPRSRSDYSEKLKRLEEEKQHLILQRKEEIFSIIDKTCGLSIDNELLSGAFILLKELNDNNAQQLPDNLKQFEQLIRGKAPIFFRKRARSNDTKL